MAGFRPYGEGNEVSSRPILPGDLMLGGENVLAGAIATVGAGTWTAADIVSGYIYRTGPVGGYTDTTDTAANILTAMAGNAPATDVVPGTTFHMLFMNTVNQTLTFAEGTGVVAGTGTLGCAGDLMREYLFTVLSTQSPMVIQANGVNGAFTLTFVLPAGRSALTEGPNGSSGNIQVGATVTGTNVGAAAVVTGVTQGIGGVTGVTVSVANSGTITNGAITFGPTIQVDTLGTRGL